MEGAFLAVARFRKPHGLKGEAVVWALTDDPGRTLAPGQALTPVDETGHPVGEALVIERSREYHRHWLLKFRDITDRTPLESWSQMLLGVPKDMLPPPAADELYEHELYGAQVLVRGEAVGVVTGLVEVPAGLLLAVDVAGREVLIPFRKEIVRRIERDGPRVEIDPPPGLLEL